MDKHHPPPQKKNVSVNFMYVLFCLWAFLTPEDGTNRLSQNVGNELLLYAAQYLSRMQNSHNSLAMQALVWLHMVQFRVIWFGAAAYANLR